MTNLSPSSPKKDHRVILDLNAFRGTQTKRQNSRHLLIQDEH